MSASSKTKEPIIALHGLPRAGKDTLAGLIVRNGLRFAGAIDPPIQFAFADALYADVAAMFEVSIADLHSHAWKTEPQEDLALWHCQHPTYRAWLRQRPTPVFDPQTSRFHLRYYGTEYTAEYSTRDHWARKLVATLDTYDEVHDGVIVITDLRRYGHSMHELEALRLWAHLHLRALIVVHIERPGYVPTAPAHSSDAVFPPGTSQVTLTNAEGAPPEAMLQQLTTFLANHPTTTKVHL
jgi:hypothetical protein